MRLDLSGSHDGVYVRLEVGAVVAGMVGESGVVAGEAVFEVSSGALDPFLVVVVAHPIVGAQTLYANGGEPSRRRLPRRAVAGGDGSFQRAIFECR